MVQDGKLNPMQTLVQTASPVQNISLNPSSKSFLIALADGSLSLWHLESLQELYQHKQYAALHGLSFTAPDDFYFVSDGQVKLLPHGVQGMCNLPNQDMPKLPSLA